MRKVLEGLNREVGVKGSLVLTADGIVVDSLIECGLKEDVVAAIASSAILTFNKELAVIDGAPFSRLVINSAHGKMVFVASGDSYLVVVLDKHINIEITMLTIASASRRIRSMTTL